MKARIVTIMIISLGLLSYAFFTACGSGTNRNTKTDESGELRGTITISGAFALYPICVRWAEEFIKIHPNVRIDISAGGAGKGMMDVLSGMVDLAMFSREILETEYEKGAWPIAVARDAVVPTISSSNPFMGEILKNGMKKEDFAKIFLSNKSLSWQSFHGKTGSNSIQVFTRSDACGAATMWANYLGKEQEDLYGTGVFGDPGIADAVKSSLYSIGYSNVNYVYDITTRKKFSGLEVIPIDLNNNGMIDPEENFYDCLDSLMQAIARDIYPSPPARDLYFISKNKPQSPVVIAFLRWILEEGQAFLDEAGYVGVLEETLKSEIEKLQ